MDSFKTVFGIKHDAQIAYEETYEAGFRNSYTALWEKFEAAEIDRHVYMLNVPLKLRPVPLVNHKARARARRRYWDEIVRTAGSAVVGYRLLPSPDAIQPNACLAPVFSMEPTRDLRA
jgi:hypothetical protein